ncbi:hypothetical protein H6G06_02580 [Anabaena sphaerica FACHB-251]|uniref:Uncharacterized protein n=1 Tax=Anabaena sphaerica FACHB-251 TaxID=2692883 RepID=A0A926WD73_9NOST|nr:hypothetical protein [Anabaena sphaerica]MBD2292395.1 hypothetical protein [Anabaena sphaerica FACHB-251]
MSDIAILKEMIKEDATVPLEEKNGKNLVTLTEPDLPNCCVTIHGMPHNNDVIIIKADKFKSPDMFIGSKGECKRADFVIVADTDTQQVILCIEMKAKTKTTTEKKIIEQLKGAKCFAAYCQKIGKEFWEQPTFLDSYVYRFVTIRNINIDIRPTRGEKTVTHDSPERMLKISSPKGLQFNRLIGGK